MKLLAGRPQPDCIDAIVVAMDMVMEMAAGGFKNDRKEL